MKEVDKLIYSEIKEKKYTGKIGSGKETALRLLINDSLNSLPKIEFSVDEVSELILNEDEMIHEEIGENKKEFVENYNNPVIINEGHLLFNKIISDK